MPKDTSQPETLGDLGDLFGRPETDVPLYLNAQAVKRAHDLERVLAETIKADAMTNEPDNAPAIARQVEAARAQAEASRKVFHLRALSHRRYARMIGENPPTAEQLADAPVNEKPEIDLDTFPGLLVRAQLVSPVVTSDGQWDAFWEELSDGQMAELWRNARALQMWDGSLGKSVLASETLRSSDDS